MSARRHVQGAIARLGRGAALQAPTDRGAHVRPEVDLAGGLMDDGSAEDRATLPALLDRPTLGLASAAEGSDAAPDPESAGRRAQECG